MSAEDECCASGSCEVCRRPRGYSREQREQIARDLDDFVPIWRREDQR